jgi:hypothetical protein
MELIGWWFLAGLLYAAVGYEFYNGSAREWRLRDCLARVLMVLVWPLALLAAIMVWTWRQFR